MQLRLNKEWSQQDTDHEFSLVTGNLKANIYTIIVHIGLSQVTNAFAH